MRTILVLAGLMLGFPVLGEVYRSVDEHGNITFSDQPSPEAEVIELRDLQTIEAPPPPEFAPRPAPAPGARYTRLAVVSPAADEPVRQNDGNITVSVLVEPGLSGSDYLVVFLDGQEVAEGRETSFPLENVDRGTHQVRVAVRSGDGSIRQQSEPVTFHLLRHSVRPPAPAPRPLPR